VEVGYFIAIIATVAVIIGVTVFLGWYLWLRVVHPGFLVPSMAVVTSISIIIGIVPTGMPVAVTVSLTIVAKRLCDTYKVLVSRLGTVETLGCVSMIASDKTGTLTQNKMTVVNIVDASGKVYSASEWKEVDTSATFVRLVRDSVVCNQARFSKDQVNLEVHNDDHHLADTRSSTRAVLGGNGVDTALLLWADAFIDVDQERAKYTVLAEVPFSSTRKYAATIATQHDAPHAPFLCIKGAPDVLTKLCAWHVNMSGEVAPFDETARRNIKDRAESLGEIGERVVALAELYLDPNAFTAEYTYDVGDFNFPIQGLTLLGLVSVQDPPRPGVREAIAECKAAHIRVMMVTGDHHTTATAIARQTGTITYDEVTRIGDYDSRDLQYSMSNLLAFQRPQISAAENPSFRGAVYHGFVTRVRGWLGFPVAVAKHEASQSTPNLRKVCRRGAISINGSELDKFTPSHWNWAGACMRTIGAILTRHTAQFDEIVFARTTPDQKLMIVKEFQARGHTVAVTGDGMNDAAALKIADCGVCMRSGTSRVVAHVHSHM
jgi:sodium/potassium-transporting ATPase subunit alpha